MKKCIDVIYDEIGRIYVYDDGTRYHSVTTMLGATADKSNLVFWKRRVGEEEAQRVSEEAAAMGEAFHLLGEKFLLNQPLPIVDRKIRRTFASAKSILTNNVTKVHAVEAPLITETYKLSGRVDAVVDWNGQLAILDFKLLGNHDTFW